MTNREAKLPGLPASGDEFWDLADTEVQKAFKPIPCDHFFVHKTATEVQCKACRIGFFLSPNWTVVEGKLVTPDGFIIGLLGSDLANG